MSDSRPLYVLLLGILGVVTCPLIGPVAIFMANRYRKDAIAEGIEPDVMARLGGILGYVGTALILLYAVLAGLAFATGMAAGVGGVLMGP